MRLIDGDAFDKALSDAQAECKRNGGNFRFGVLANVRGNLSKVPSVDAVPVTRCTACKHWDSNSGLTARKCDKWDAFTTQWDYCSYGRKTDGTDNP
jgi:hypothetical protein